MSETLSREKRKYIRLKSAFTVEFTIVRLQDELLDFGWLKGTMRDVSKGGLCLETEILTESVIKYLNKGSLNLELKIYASDAAQPLRAIAEVCWYETLSAEKNRFVMGMEFRSILKKDLDILLGKAQK